MLRTHSPARLPGVALAMLAAAGAVENVEAGSRSTAIGVSAIVLAPPKPATRAVLQQGTNGWWIRYDVEY